MAANKADKAPAKPQKGKAGVSGNKPGKLTTKRRKLIKGIAEGKTQRQAAKDAGLNECHASVILKEPQVRATIQELMESHGLDDASILKVHADMIKATRGDEPDWTARSKGVEMAYRLKGAFIEKSEVKHSGEITTGSTFSDTERSARLLFLLEQAEKRAKLDK